MNSLHSVVQPDLETQQEDDLCDMGVLSATFEKIYLNLAREKALRSNLVIQVLSRDTTEVSEEKGPDSSPSVSDGTVPYAPPQHADHAEQVPGQTQTSLA